MRYAHEELGHFRSNKYIACSKHSTSGEGCNYKFSNLALGVWCVTTLIDYGVWVLMEFGFC